MNELGLFEKTKLEITQLAKKHKIPHEKIENFLTPDKIIEVKIPVKIKNKNIILNGFRSQHNNKLGPYKGGLRFHENVTKDEVMALSLWMSLKCAIANLPFGGGKGGVSFNPKLYSEKELELISRTFSKALYENIGPYKDIPAPDVNTNPKIIDWMTDEYINISQKEKIKNKNLKTNQLFATFTGKNKNGLAGRSDATGFGGVVILEELVKLLNIKPNDASIAVMGFGNVGYFFSYYAWQKGYKVIAVSDSKGGIVKKTKNEYLPLDIPLVDNCRKEKGTLSGCYCAGGVCDTNGGQLITNEDLLELPVKILVPAALEGAINENNMHKIKAKIIIEMANGPITPKAREYLIKKGIIIVPDILANSGGVTGSYIEWEQNIKNKKYKKEETLNRISEMMKNAFTDVWKMSKRKKTNLIEASYLVALNKLI